MMTQTLDPQRFFFTIYQSQRAIELRLGCDDYPSTRIISTSRSYESAYQVALSAAVSKQLPLENYVPMNLVAEPV
ncbi:MAG: hypothetical protein SFW36_21950 [Leptolyngbyaceae cyanobacterium bins.59]|nr:hypothetical protein [Leptolyngbyaceae cyanobacterium bins.59]